jgi:hypothetical protein
MGDRLIGLYLFGSPDSGDFDYRVSDIDLLAAVSPGVSAEELEGTA